MILFKGAIKICRVVKAASGGYLKHGQSSLTAKQTCRLFYPFGSQIIPGGHAVKAAEYIIVRLAFFSPMALQPDKPIIKSSNTGMLANSFFILLSFRQTLKTTLNPNLAPLPILLVWGQTKLCQL